MYIYVMLPAASVLNSFHFSKSACRIPTLTIINKMSILWLIILYRVAIDVEQTHPTQLGIGTFDGQRSFIKNRRTRTTRIVLT